MRMNRSTRLIRQAREVLQIEAQGILDLVERIGQEFEQAVQMIIKSKGRIILTGIGKSGLIGRKISATLNSTGTPSLFLHPAEALHGDLGMVTSDDVVIAVSNSGYTKELIQIAPALKDIGAKLIVFCGDSESPLARESLLTIDVGVEREACPLGLAPTTSTTAALAMGDALAVALVYRRRFNRKDFRRFHPGGTLGSRLSREVGEVMLKGDRIPLVSADQTVREALFEMDKKKVGACLVVDDGRALLGVVTDGDIRRSLLQREDIMGSRVHEIMAPSLEVIIDEQRVADAIELMERDGVTVLPVVDKGGKVVGVIHLPVLLGHEQRGFHARNEAT
jgi:arabinose-5-phosphate isomerase